MGFWSKVVSAAKAVDKAVEDGLNKLDEVEKKYCGDTDAKVDAFVDEKLVPTVEKVVAKGEEVKRLKEKVLPEWLKKSEEK
jgi:hypothetical protein